MSLDRTPLADVIKNDLVGPQNFVISRACFSVFDRMLNAYGYRAFVREVSADLKTVRFEIDKWPTSVK